MNTEYASTYTNPTKAEVIESLHAVGFMESSLMGGRALRLPTEWVSSVVVLLEGCGPTLVLNTPGGQVFADLSQRADVDDDAKSRLEAAPEPSHGDCDQCGHWHRKGEEHCPNCGQPAESGFHASMNLDDCPCWVFGRWVMPADLTAAEKAELERPAKTNEQKEDNA